METVKLTTTVQKLNPRTHPHAVFSTMWGTQILAVLGITKHLPSKWKQLLAECFGSLPPALGNDSTGYATVPGTQ